MDTREESSRFGSVPNITIRTLSSSSSAFYSAIQSPFFSPKSPSLQSSKHFDIPCDVVSSVPADGTSSDLQKVDQVSSSTGISNKNLSISVQHNDDHFRHTEKHKKIGRSQVTSSTPSSTLFASNRIRSYDVFIGFHGRKTLLLRFPNWLRAELEAQGLSCFVTDRARCRNSRKHSIVWRAMDACTFGVVILTRSCTISWGRSSSIDEKRKDRQPDSSKKKGKESVFRFSEFRKINGLGKTTNSI